jgi:hypothetical protein
MYAALLSLLRFFHYQYTFSINVYSIIGTYRRFIQPLKKPLLARIKQGISPYACRERLYTQAHKKLVGLTMKFLIMQKVKREVALEKWSKLLPLQFKYFEKLEAEGTLELYYHLIGQQGSMLIVNVESDEKLSRVIGQDPLFFDLEREIYPLTTRQTHEKQIREMLGQDLGM